MFILLRSILIQFPWTHEANNVTNLSQPHKINTIIVLQSTYSSHLESDSNILQSVLTPTQTRNTEHHLLRIPKSQIPQKSHIHTYTHLNHTQHAYIQNFICSVHH